MISNRVQLPLRQERNQSLVRTFTKRPFKISLNFAFISETNSLFSEIDLLAKDVEKKKTTEFLPSLSSLLTKQQNHENVMSSGKSSLVIVRHHRTCVVAKTLEKQFYLMLVTTYIKSTCIFIHYMYLDPCKYILYLVIIEHTWTKERASKK